MCGVVPGYCSYSLSLVRPDALSDESQCCGTQDSNKRAEPDIAARIGRWTSARVNGAFKTGKHRKNQ